MSIISRILRVSTNVSNVKTETFNRAKAAAVISPNEAGLSPYIALSTLLS